MQFCRIVSIYIIQHDRKIAMMGIAAMMAVSAMSISAFADSNIDTNFIPDDMMNENSISPEEFTELTGISFNQIDEDEADALIEQSNTSLFRASKSTVGLTWAKTKPYNDGLWDWKMVFNLEDYNVSSNYTSYATSNTYSQEAVELSANDDVLIKMTPNDNKSDSVRVYVHIVDETTKAETTFSAYTVTNAAKTVIISNPQNKDMNVVMNLANASYSKRTGTITMNLV